LSTFDFGYMTKSILDLKIGQSAIVKFFSDSAVSLIRLAPSKGVGSCIVSGHLSHLN